MTGLLPDENPGPVLAGVKATPSGWPAASLSGCGRPIAGDGSKPGPTSANFRSLRFEGIAAFALLNGEAGPTSSSEPPPRTTPSISAINYSEAIQKAVRQGVSPEQVDVALDDLGVAVIPFGRLDARLTASFYRHPSGLSLADRVCLALVRSLSSPAYTTDRLWASWAEDLGVIVRVIR